MTKQQLIEDVFGKDANLYRDALLIDENASEEQVEQAYLKQWQQARQMLKPGLARSKTSEIEMRLEGLLIAYRILSNPELRIKYDDMLLETANNSSKHKNTSPQHQTSSLKSISEMKTPRSKQKGSPKRISPRNKNKKFTSPQEKDVNSDKFMFSAKSTQSLRKDGKKVKQTKGWGSNNGLDNSMNFSSGSMDITTVPQFEHNGINRTSDDTFEMNIDNSFFSSNSFDFSNNPFSNSNDDDEDVFAGVADDIHTTISYDQGSQVSHNSKRGYRDSNDLSSVHSSHNNTAESVSSYHSNRMKTKSNMSQTDYQNNNDLDHLSVVSGRTQQSNISMRSTNTGGPNSSRSSLRKSRYMAGGNTTTNNDLISETGDYSEQLNSNLNVRFQDINDKDGNDTASLDLSQIDNVGDTDTLDDSTVEDSIVTHESYEYDDDNSINKSGEAPAYLNMLCLPKRKNSDINSIFQTISEEIKGSFDDTLSAMDQVFNAFTIQPDEYSELVTKIETEKQTLLFSSEFMKLAKAEQRKRLKSETERIRAEKNREQKHKSRIR